MDPQTTQTDTTTTARMSRGNQFLIPGAILIGFAMIAAALYFGGMQRTSQVAQNGPGLPATNTPSNNKPIRPVDKNDHILGNPNAPIVFVEYSDFDCPFCKKFHDEVVKPLMDEYGSTGKVAWVYRHFPLPQLHPNAPKLAIASECVAELGGNDAFWKFSDIIFGSRGVNEQTNMAKLPDYAKQAGVDPTKFSTCLEEQRHKDVVDADYADGLAAGVQGTPHTFVLVGDQQGEINGAQPYATVKTLVDNLIKQLDGSSTPSTN